MKNLAILGSSGSIGVQTLNVIRNNPGKFNVVSIVANNNVDLVYKQAQEFKPKYIGFSDESVYEYAKTLFGKNVTLVCGKDALTGAVELKEVDLVVAAVVGMDGLESVISAIGNKKDIALANKESLVSGGRIVTELAEINGVRLLPVDSEHSAVWQCLNSGKDNLNRIILTASGGAFYGKSKQELKNITPEMATKHPNWSMGKKITVDSSTMMNKGLEIIEASFLFGTNNIDYIIHPESIIHSMIEYDDGSIIAQLSNPNMEIPIALALSYPDRLVNDLPKYNFTKNITFSKPDEENFPLPAIAKQALSLGGNAPCILNSVNEAAVQLFLDKKIGFLDITDIIKNVIENCEILKTPSISDIYQTHFYWKQKLMTDYKRYLWS